MKRLRTRVRLTARDWKTIAEAMSWLIGWSGAGMLSRSGVWPRPADCQRVLRRIGVDGMAARDRGVAPVRKTRS